MENPIDISGSLQSARDAISMGELDRAIGLLTGVVPLAPDRWEPKELLGTAYLRKGMVQAGLETLHAASAQSPTGSSARYSYAAGLQSTGHGAEAVREYQEMLRVNPADPYATRALGALGAMPQPAPGLSMAPPRVPLTSPPPAPQYPQPPAPMQNYPAASGAAPQYAPAPGLASQYHGAVSPGAPPIPASPQPMPQYGGAGQPSPYGAPSLAGGYTAPQRAAPPRSAPYPQPSQRSAPATPGAPYLQPSQRAVPLDDEGGWSFSNLIRVIISPRSFMAEQRGQTGLSEPVKYCAGLIVVGSLLALVIGLASAFANGAGSAAAGANPGGLALGLIMGLLISAVSLAIAAAVGVVAAMAAAGAFHLLVLIFRGGGGYGATFRAFVYACTPGALIGPVLMMTPRMLPGISLMPVWWIVSLWALALFALGLKEIHEMSLPGAIVVALLPGAGLSLCIFLLAQLVLNWGHGGLAALPGGRPQFGPTSGAFGPPPGFGPNGQPPGFGPNSMPPGFGPNGRPPGFGPNGMPPGFGPNSMPPGFGPNGRPPGFGPNGMPPGFGPNGRPPVFVPPAGSSGWSTTTTRTVGPDGKVHVVTKKTYFGGAKPPP